MYIFYVVQFCYFPKRAKNWSHTGNMPKDTSETQKGATGLARAAIVVVCVVLTVFGFFSGSHLSDEHEEVHTFEMAKYKSIGARHRTEVAVDQNRDRSSYAAGASQAQNGRGVSKNTAGGRGRPDPKDGPVDWANVPCDDMSLDGRKFLVASFIDEQVCFITRTRFQRRARA